MTLDQHTWFLRGYVVEAAEESEEPDAWFLEAPKLQTPALNF